MFHKFNPQFGRKSYKIVTNYADDFKRVLTGRVVEFNDKHIAFNNVEKQNTEYLSDHLKYNDAIYVNESVVVRRSFTFNFVNHINFNDDDDDDYEEEDYDEDEDDGINTNQVADNNNNEVYDDEEEDEEDDIVENNAVTVEQLEDYDDTSDIDSTS
jgi:hypothetical protein